MRSQALVCSSILCAPTLSSTVVYLTGMVALYGLKQGEEREMRVGFWPLRLACGRRAARRSIRRT